MWAHAVWIHGGGTNQATLSDLERQEKERVSFLSPGFVCLRALTKVSGWHWKHRTRNPRLRIVSESGDLGSGVFSRDQLSFQFQNEAGFLFYKHRAWSGLKNKIQACWCLNIKKHGVSQVLLSNRDWLKPGAEEAVGAELESGRIFFPQKWTAQSNIVNNLSPISSHGRQQNL